VGHDGVVAQDVATTIQTISTLLGMKTNGLHLEGDPLGCLIAIFDIDPCNTSTLYLAVDQSGMWKTTDAGVPVRSLMGPAGRSSSQGHGTTPFASRRDHPRGRDEEFFAASWDQPICRGQGTSGPNAPGGS
jgi:hypothetical protein